MSAPNRKRKKSVHKDRFQDAIGAMDRWTLPRLPVDAPWKRYAILCSASAVGGLIVFGGILALISPEPKKEIAGNATNQTKSRFDPKHTKIVSATSQHKTGSNDVHPDAPKAMTLMGTAFISGSNAAIRERPAINAKIVERAVFGSNVELIAQEGKWVQVRSTGQNISGWIEKVYLSF